MFANRKQLLCEIARREGELGLREFSHKAGPQIEKYLAVFRQPIYEISQQACFLDLTQGYDWCCAFVYWCCQQAGYEIPIRASLDSRYTLAAVGHWIEYARNQKIWRDREKIKYLPQAGDLVIFDKLLSQNPLDHIGIVLSYDLKKKFIETAEGNVNKATGIFKRPTNETIKGYICLPI
ncbi:CHAP domain-containing protein [Candidatus Protochlamydia sp. W-9]|uniref:CHAP domain-containing protein n=1 Tax=Candidatus Protochlamydia sp. W-9 TaxID=1785087 RepID=UPI00096A560D|nr:CHAP domain-containing protein [Candidatus Protochlamydia sp. W-9]